MNARVPGLATGRVENPAIEEAVLLVDILVLVVGTARVRGTSFVNREVLAGRERTVVLFAHLVAACENGRLELFGRIGPLVHETRDFRRAGGTRSPHTTITDTKSRRVLLGELGDSATHAIVAAWLAGMNLDNLGRRNIEVIFARVIATILVLHHQVNDL